MRTHQSVQIAAKSLVFFISVVCLGAVCQSQDEPWSRYVIDDSLRGADGARLADANADGLLDIVTGWEESGEARAYFHPGAEAVRQAWPFVKVGDAPSIEDAVWVDLTADGRLDVLSSCEGQEQSLRLHVAPAMDRLLDPTAWETIEIPASKHRTRWMFALPFGQSSNSPAISRVIVGSKSPNGMVGMLTSDQGTPSSWRIEKLTDANWIMSLLAADLDRDGDPDILISDRKPNASGVYWLENPGNRPEPSAPDADWPKHLVGALGREVMFVATNARIDPAASRETTEASRDTGVTSGQFEIYVAVKPNQIHKFAQTDQPDRPWEVEVILVEPTDRIGNAKGVAVGDLDLDGRVELVLSCESASNGKSGVVFLTRTQGSEEWSMRDVSGPEGIKFDLIKLVDLDLDGDLDILTCEERERGRGLGVIWYANPKY